jgi:ATP-dependent protease ClpP protease subunit
MMGGKAFLGLAVCAVALLPAGIGAQSAPEETTVEEVALEPAPPPPIAPPVIVPALETAPEPKAPPAPVFAPAPPSPMPFTVAPPTLKLNDITVSADGKTAQLVGQIGDGIAQRLSAILTKNGDVETLVLTSDGGLLTEGVALAHLVRKYSLNTHVEFLCGSACTFPLLAGVQRSIAPGGVVGFHQASSGLTTLMNPMAITGDDAGNRLMRTNYAAANMSSGMIDQALETGPDSMWFPDTPALQANNVVNRITKPTEYDATVPGWKSMQDYTAALNRDPLWVAARAAKPQHYGYAAGAGWIAAAKFGDKAGSLRFARATLVRRILSDAATYPDALLLEFAAHEQKIWKDTTAVYNRECSYGPGLRVPVGEPKEALREPQMAIFKKMLAIPSAPAVIDSDARNAAQAQAMQFWGRMIAEHGFSAYMVSSNFCREPLSYYEEMAKLPAGERASLLRALIVLNGMALR